MLGAVVSTLTACAMMAPAPWTAELDAELDRRLKRYPGKLGIFVHDVERDDRFGRNAHVPMYLASGVKLAFMTAAYAAMASGALRLDETLPYTTDDLRDGAPRANKHRLGRPIPVRTLLEWMMRSSDNAASDLFIDRLGVEFVQATLDEQGLLGFGPISRLIEVRRGIYRQLDPRADDLSPAQIRKIRWTPIWDPQLRRLERELGRPPRSFSRQDLFDAYDRFYATGVNRAPMSEVGRLLEKIVRGTLVSAEASAQMLALMSGARTSRHRLLGRLPRGTPVVHKTGSQYLHFCDLGIVFLPRAGAKHPQGAPLVVTMCTEAGELEASEALMAAAARKAYDLALAAGS